MLKAQKLASLPIGSNLSRVVASLGVRGIQLAQNRVGAYTAKTVVTYAEIVCEREISPKITDQN